jgi:hypothetical protein
VVEPSKILNYTISCKGTEESIDSCNIKPAGATDKCPLVYEKAVALQVSCTVNPGNFDFTFYNY